MNIEGLGFDFDITPTEKGAKVEMTARLNGEKVKTVSYFYEKRTFAFTEVNDQLVGGVLPGEDKMSIDR